MKLALLTYLVLTIPAVADLLVKLFAVVAMLWLVVGFIIYMEGMGSYWQRPLRHLKWMIPVVVLCILVPSKEDAKVIAGVYIAAEAASWISEVEGVAQLPGNLVEFINNKLVPVEGD